MADHASKLRKLLKIERSKRESKTIRRLAKRSNILRQWTVDYLDVSDIEHREIDNLVHRLQREES